MRTHPEPVAIVPVPRKMAAWLAGFYAGKPYFRDSFDKEVANRFAIYEFGLKSGGEMAEIARDGIREFWRKEGHRADFAGADLEQLPLSAPVRLDALNRLAEIAGTTGTKLLQAAAAKAFENRVAFVLIKEGPAG